MWRHKIAHLRLECRELGDAVGADAIDADVSQRLPLIGVVSGPGDDSGVDGVRARNELFIDVRNLLPQILGPSGDERSDRIDVTRDLQHAGSHRWEDALHRFDDAMVERVDGALRFALADNAHHERLDARRLYLDINPDIRAQRIEYRRERRNLDVLGKPEFADLRGRQLSDGTGRESGRIYDRVVVDDDGSVFGGVDVELDRIRAQLDGANESRNRILGQRLMSTTVGDSFGRVAPAWCVQAFPRVVVLGTMSAKL
jgi:hypothetical protein